MIYDDNGYGTGYGRGYYGQAPANGGYYAPIYNENGGYGQYGASEQPPQGQGYAPNGGYAPAGGYAPSEQYQGAPYETYPQNAGYAQPEQPSYAHPAQPSYAQPEQAAYEPQADAPAYVPEQPAYDAYDVQGQYAQQAYAPEQYAPAEQGYAPAEQGYAPAEGYAPEQTQNAGPADPEFYQPVSVKKHGQANIVVVGVGGAGSNAVNNMVRSGIKSASFVVMNTDMQALNMSAVEPHCRIQLGDKTTEGLGAGSDPEVGRLAAEESKERIKCALKGIDLLFITAGMGGGTGTGAAPVVAEVARDLGILTVGVVTKPFNFEGGVRMKNAEEGIKKLKDFVDTLLVIPNEKLFKIKDDITFKDAFKCADDVLRQGVQSVSDVIAFPGIVNLDFADVRTILSKKGLAHMGIGHGKGEKRVIEAIREAICSPLIETDIEGATAIIINIIGGEDIKLTEVEEACDMVHSVVDPGANIIFGMATQPDRQDIEITIIATGFSADKKNSVLSRFPQPAPRREEQKAEQSQPEAPKAAPRYPERPSFGSSRPTPPRPQVNETGQPNDSVVKVPQRPVPTFLRRMHNDDQGNK